jgi:hypothetical protein
MSVKEALDKVLEALPEERLREVLDFAEFLNERGERGVAPIRSGPTRSGVRAA